MKFTAYSTTSTGWADGRPATVEQLDKAGIRLVEPGCPEHPSKWLVEAPTKAAAEDVLSKFRITVPDPESYCFSGCYGVYEA